MRLAPSSGFSQLSINDIKTLDEVFVRGYEGYVQLPRSSNVLKAKTTGSTVSIFDIKDRLGQTFYAAESLSDGRSALYFNIVTKKPDGSRHPDLRAAWLMRRAITYFEQDIRGGVPLPRILGIWSTGAGVSDNYRQYQENLERLGAGHELAAAQETWTGRRAYDLGFTVVADVLQIPAHPDYIEVLFDRPPAQST